MEPLTPESLAEFARLHQETEAGIAQDRETIADIVARAIGPTLDGIAQDKEVIGDIFARLEEPIRKGIKSDRRRLNGIFRKVAQDTIDGIAQDRTVLTGIAARAQHGSFPTEPVVRTNPGGNPRPAQVGQGKPCPPKRFGATRQANPGLRPPVFQSPAVPSAGRQNVVSATPPGISDIAPPPRVACKDTEVFDPATGQCVEVQCPPGYHWDPLRQRCEPDQIDRQCEPGFHWDDSTQQCVPDAIDHHCPPGTTWDDATQQCVPTDGQQFCAYCVTQPGHQPAPFVGPPGYPFPAGTVGVSYGCYDTYAEALAAATAACPPTNGCLPQACPPGQHWDSVLCRCVPDSNHRCTITCPPGWTLDEEACICTPPPPPPNCDPCLAWIVQVFAGSINIVVNAINNVNLNITGGNVSFADLCACIMRAADRICACLPSGVDSPPAAFVPPLGDETIELDEWEDVEDSTQDERIGDALRAFGAEPGGAVGGDNVGLDVGDAFAQGPPAGGAETGGFNPAIFGD